MSETLYNYYSMMIIRSLNFKKNKHYNMISKTFQSKMLSYCSIEELEETLDKELESQMIIISLTRNIPDITNYSSCIKSHYHFPIYDHENECFIRMFHELCDLINNYIINDIDVIVHCRCGISRSTTLVIAYMIYNQKITYIEAINQLNDLMVSPNDGFVQQLKIWEHHIINGDELMIESKDYIKPFPKLVLLNQ